MDPTVPLSNTISPSVHDVVETKFNRQDEHLHQLNKNFPGKRRWHRIDIIKSMGTNFDSFLQGNVGKESEILKEQRNGDEVKN